MHALKVWLKRYIDNVNDGMPKSAALKSLENGAGASKFPPDHIIVPQVVKYFVVVMRTLLVLLNHAKPSKFSQTAALYVLFRLRRMEMYGGAQGGLVNGPNCVNVWVHKTFRFEVTAILRECIEPVEAAFHEEYERLERSFAVDFCKLQKVMTFNSSVDAPLSQRLLVGDGGPLSWWMTLVNEMGPGFTSSMRINKQHKGFDQMVDTAVKMHLIFEDVYLPGADSPQGTWTGITVEHTYEFVFLCFMNAYAKKIDEKFQLKIKALFPGKSICHAGPVKSLQRCNEKNFSLPLLENEEPLQMYRLPRCAGLLDLNRVTLTFDTAADLLEANAKIMDDPDLLVINEGRVKNGYLKSFAAPGGYRDLKINPVLKGAFMVCEIQLTLRSFMDIKKESHPYYALWRVLSEWCDENKVGKRGEIKLQSAIDHYETKATTTELLNLHGGLAGPPL